MLRTRLGPLLAVTLLAIPAGVRAEEKPAEPAAQAPAGPDLVIALDLADSATSNSQLRAALYEVARRHGYSAAGKIDVDGIAAQRSLMKAGSVTSDPKELTDLRLALGVSVLVRVSKDFADASGISARVTLVTARGVHAEVVHVAGAGASQPLEATLDRMLPSVLPPPKPRDEPKKVIPEGAFGTITSAEAKPDTTLPPKEAWEKRGGLRPMYGAVALGSVTRLTNVPFSDLSPANRVETGKADAMGFGGGFGVRLGLMYLPMPEPNLSSGSFVAFKLGIGIDNDFFWVRTPIGFDYSGSGTTRFGNEALWVASGQAHAGLAFAAGRFSSETRWSGVLIGLAYAPALQYSVDLSSTSGVFRGNLAGVEASVDVTTLDAAKGPEGQMQIRASIWALAPQGDDHPGLLSIGLGVIWY